MNMGGEKFWSRGNSGAAVEAEINRLEGLSEIKCSGCIGARKVLSVPPVDTLIRQVRGARRRGLGSRAGGSV